MIWVLANSCLLMVGVLLVDLSVWRFNLENLRFYGVLPFDGVHERFACALFGLKLGFVVGVDVGW